MIIDTHGWINKTEHWGKQSGDLMDQSWKASPGYSETRSVHQKTGIVGRYTSVEELVQMMDEAGVDKTLLHAMTTPSFNVKVPNEWNAEQIKQRPDRLIGLGSVYELGGKQAIDELEEIGFKDLNYQLTHMNKNYVPFLKKNSYLDNLLKKKFGWLLVVTGRK